jgi:hypothetical protein
MIAMELRPKAACELCESACDSGPICRSCADDLERDLRSGDEDARKLLRQLGLLCGSCEGNGESAAPRTPWSVRKCGECAGTGVQSEVA